METKVFRTEILKPINYDWKDFYSILNKATFASARIANEVMMKQYLLSKGEISRKGSTFCKLIESCKGSQLHASLTPVVTLTFRSYSSSWRDSSGPRPTTFKEAKRCGQEGARSVSVVL